MGEAVPVRSFRPARGIIPLVFVCGLPFALFAVYGPWSLGPRHPGWWLMLMSAGSAAFCCVFAPAIILTTEVVVSPAGLSKCPRWNGGFNVEWSQVESWVVEGPQFPSDDAQLVRLRVAGRRQSVVVYDIDVEWPGFAAFVTSLREVAKDREAVAPN